MEVPLTDIASDTSNAPPSNPAISDNASPPDIENASAPPPSKQTSYTQPDTGNEPRKSFSPDTIAEGNTAPHPISASIDLITRDQDSALPTPNLGPRNSEPDLQSSETRPSMGVAPQQETEGSTITVANLVDMQADHVSSTIPASAVTTAKQHVLSHEMVVSGKGLGRGRPGVKRGPRNVKDQILDAVSSPGASTSATPGPSEPAYPPSKKRKSGTSIGSLINAQVSTSDSVTTPSRESSQEYNPTATQTRSGRHSQRPVSITDLAAVSASPSRKPTRTDRTASATSASPATVKTHPKIKRRIYRGREQFALCEHCLRGHGPPVNVIVFCDACNKCWHQRCHDPPISKQTVSDTKAEWFCAECDRILHGAKKGKRTVKTTAQPVVTPPITKPPLVYDGPLVGGRLLDARQKLAYLNTLSKDDLVSLLLDASNLAPDLPLFKRLVSTDFPQAQFTSTYVTPVSKPPMFADKELRTTTETVDEGYDDYFDDHAALYPKPGNGVQLPPESEDLHILLEGKESKTFSHWVRGMGGKDFSGTGNVIP